jgi:sarcosine oxidase gamma subunit
MATLSGRLEAAGEGPGHYFVLHEPTGDQILVFAAAGAALRPGQATVRGGLHRGGRYRDEVTGRAANAVLTQAVPV